MDKHSNGEPSGANRLARFLAGVRGVARKVREEIIRRASGPQADRMAPNGVPHPDDPPTPDRVMPAQPAEGSGEAVSQHPSDRKEVRGRMECEVRAVGEALLKLFHTHHIRIYGNKTVRVMRAPDGRLRGTLTDPDTGKASWCVPEDAMKALGFQGRVVRRLRGKVKATLSRREYLFDWLAYYGDRHLEVARDNYRKWLESAVVKDVPVEPSDGGREAGPGPLPCTAAEKDGEEAQQLSLQGRGQTEQQDLDKAVTPERETESVPCI